MINFRLLRRFATEAPAPSKNPKVYFDINIAGQPKGRLTFEVLMSI